MNTENEIREILVRIETRLDHFIQQSADHEERIRHLERSEEIENRLRSLEKFKNMYPAAMVTALVLAIGSVVGNFVPF